MRQRKGNTQKKKNVAGKAVAVMGTKYDGLLIGMPSELLNIILFNVLPIVPLDILVGPGGRSQSVMAQASVLKRRHLAWLLLSPGTHF